MNGPGAPSTPGPAPRVGPAAQDPRTAPQRWHQLREASSSYRHGVSAAPGHHNLHIQSKGGKATHEVPRHRR